MHRQSLQFKQGIHLAGPVLSWGCAEVKGCPEDTGCSLSEFYFRAFSSSVAMAISHKYYVNGVVTVWEIKEKKQLIPKVSWAVPTVSHGRWRNNPQSPWFCHLTIGSKMRKLTTQKLTSRSWVLPRPRMWYFWHVCLYVSRITKIDKNCFCGSITSWTVFRARRDCPWLTAPQMSVTASQHISGQLSSELHSLPVIYIHSVGITHPIRSWNK